MNKRRHAKLVREGPYAAEVEVELIEAASRHARVFSLTPVSR